MRDDLFTRFETSPAFGRVMRSLGSLSWIPGPMFSLHHNATTHSNKTHYNAPYQAYLNAWLVLPYIGTVLDKRIPFRLPDSTKKQTGFGTFGRWHILSLFMKVATTAIEAV